jgi:hypothetical protein
MESDRRKREKFMLTLSKVPEPERVIIRKRHKSCKPREENQFVILLTSAIEGCEPEEQIEYLRYVARLSDDEFKQELVGLEHDPIKQFLKRVGKNMAVATLATGTVTGLTGVYATAKLNKKQKELANYIHNLRRPFWKR